MAVEGIFIEKTPRSVLALLENDLVTNKDRKQLVNWLIDQYPTLDKCYQERTEKYVMRRGTKTQKSKLGRAAEAVGGKPQIHSDLD